MTHARRRLVASATLLALLAACGRSDPERELRATIAEMTGAIEQRRPAAFVEHMADDFTRESAAFDKAEARRVLAGLMLRHASIGVTTIVERVQIEGTRAQAQLRVVATGGDGLFPQSGQAWSVETHWRRENNRWLVYNADWREAF